MRWLWILGLFFLNACSATYEKTALKSWDLMRAGDADDALKIYEKEVDRSQDKLLLLMDEGILLRSAGRFAESNQKFFSAAKIIEMNGYLDLGEQAVTLVSNERMTTYQGEDFEKVLVHLYLGLNFLDLHQEEEALVEARKVNEIIQVMVSEGKRPYEFNAFARYLGAMLFENEGDLNDALVAYRNTLKISPELESQFPTLKIDMLRIARRLGMNEEVQEWKKKFGDEADAQAIEINKNKYGSIALLYEAGKSPIKISSKVHRQTKGRGGSLVEVAIPVSYYERRPSKTGPITMKVGAKESLIKKEARSQILNDIESTAIRQLQDRMGRVIAKALLTAAVKAGVGVAVGKATDSKELGALAAIAMVLMSEADTRSWLLLPANFQIARVFVPAGNYRVEFEGGLSPMDVTVKSGKTTFVQRRSFD